MFEALGPASLLLFVRGHNEYFHPDDPELDQWTLTSHPGYKSPETATKIGPPVKQRDSRLEPYGMCAKDKDGLTQEDRKWLSLAKIRW